MSNSSPSNGDSQLNDLFNSSLSSSSLSKLKISAMRASYMLFFLYICTLVLTHWSDFRTLTGNTTTFSFKMHTKKTFQCKATNMTVTCPSSHPSQTASSNPETCPEYFRWIHEDLSTWRDHGITKQMVDSLIEDAHFRLTVVNGIAYVVKYHNVFQTRDVLTLWGILQLLNMYPGRVPDFDLVFQCADKSSVKRERYQGSNLSFAPPQFHYCADESTLDIVFPDWSFWGWPQLSIKPWVPLVKDLKDGNAMKNWTSREPFAFWKGNTFTGLRRQLAQCNSIQEWGAQIVEQDWPKEVREGFKSSDLSKQCAHRYKIYMEGYAWSVSEKYILACDAMTLFVEPVYYDFFTRSLIPLKHYWAVDPNNLCESIKFAVDWGNKHPDKAQEIGRAGSEYIFNQLKIENVYDYMFHVLNEYAKLLRYKPTVPEGAEELCSERFACSPPGLETKYKTETMVNTPSDRGPCVLPEPYDSDTIRTLREQNAKIKEMVKMWGEGSE